jgi:DNA-binding LytR/AlgR family response regulator
MPSMQRSFVDALPSLAAPARIRDLRSLSHGDFTLILKDGTELTLSRAHRPHLEAWLRQPI